MHAIIAAIALALLFTLPPGQAGAAIYSYKDAGGRTVYVDDPQKIPSQYRGASTTIEAQRPVQPEPEKDAEGKEKPVEPPATTIIDRDTERRARQQVEQLDRERTYQTPVMVRGNRVLVPVEVAFGGRVAHLMLLLDTGSTSTVLHRPALKELPVPPGEKISAKVAGGRTLSSEKVVTGYLDVGPFLMKDFPVMLITPQGPSLPFDGMLGMDFLKQHPYEVDYRNEIIRWKPQQ